MIITVLRTVIMYIFVVIVLRIMGKRQIGELEASELVVTIIISEIAALPITDTGVPLSGCILAILILLIMEIFISQAAYKSVLVRTVLYGKPSTFYKNGRLNQAEMEKQRFNVADLMEEIRNSGAVSLNQVDYIVMETNGKVSVVLNAESNPLTPSDMNVRPKPLYMNYIIIDNGNLITQNMKRFGLNEEWLYAQLKENGIKRINDVFYLSFEESTGNVVIIPKNGKNKKRGASK